VADCGRGVHPPAARARDGDQVQRVSVFECVEVPERRLPNLQFTDDAKAAFQRVPKHLFCSPQLTRDWKRLSEQNQRDVAG